ncbi:LOW QUALITY PROTEIN: complement component 1 Q subcomponent-binding protein, mitochondrial-like [Lemur catta]|uniref:LOW QUALITY PROTEIN: complement component 1 Q subcomponent-binding protein, mitochondrial-like n=1 Tax=Lemur catta TaxID=9447 RepID=UPI001E26BC18|nr:LOW QUALITY PROTEIN: complement component 1 Q subcomponent-binding protein, mitochondrial-like [Lemur catta]
MEMWPSRSQSGSQIERDLENFKEVNSKCGDLKGPGWGRGLPCPSVRAGTTTKKCFFQKCWPRPCALLQPLGPCSCGGSMLHTEGDKACFEFPSDEIKEEKKIQKHKSLPKMSGVWELEVNGTEAKLVQKVARAKITVTFNINNSIPPTFDNDKEPSQGQKVEEQETELTSTLNFVVEVINIKNDGKKSLVLDGLYPEDEVGQEEEAEGDIFTIRKVSFQSPSESEWKDTNHTLETTLYKIDKRSQGGNYGRGLNSAKV